MWNYSIRSMALAVVFFLSAACDYSATEPLRGTAVSPDIKHVNPPESILFIGNSFTYYNDGVDQYLQRLAASAQASVKLQVGRQTTPSQDFSGHFHDPRTKAALLRKEWDLVVLQGKSDEPLARQSRESFFQYAKLLADQVEQSGARTALFMTWAYRNRPTMTAPLHQSYVNAGNESGAIVVPVGLAWERVRSERSNRFLYSDNRHPSVEGTYLSACVFYASLLGASPEGFAYTAGLSRADALYLQRVAWETTAIFYERET